MAPVSLTPTCHLSGSTTGMSLGVRFSLQSLALMSGDSGSSPYSRFQRWLTGATTARVSLGVSFFLQSTALMSGNSGTDARFPSRVRQNVVVG